MDGKSVRLQDALSKELYNYIITEMSKEREVGQVSGTFDLHWTGIKPEDLKNEDVKNNIRKQIKEIFSSKSIEELMSDKILIDTKQPNARGILFKNVFDTNKRIKQLIKDNCCNFDEVRRDIKEFLSENGIDPDRPCFMQETRSLFGVKEKTKGEEQRTESTLKRRKSSDI